MLLRTSYQSWQEAVRQTATVLMSFFNGERLTRGIDTKDELVIDLTTSGVVLKSPDGHYWRITVSNAGALITTDAGTTKP